MSAPPNRFNTFAFHRTRLTRQPEQQPKATREADEGKTTPLGESVRRRNMIGNRPVRRSPTQSISNTAVGLNVDPLAILKDERNLEGSSPFEDDQIPYELANESSENETGNPDLIRAPGPEYFEDTIINAENFESSESSSTTHDSSQGASSSPTAGIEGAPANPISVSEGPPQQVRSPAKREAYREYKKTTAAQRRWQDLKKINVNPENVSLTLNAESLQKSESSSSTETDPGSSDFPERRLGQILPKRKKSDKTTELKKTLSPLSPRTLIREAQEAKAAKKAEKAKEAKLQAIFDNLPKGATLENGKLGGGHHIDQTSDEFTGLPGAKASNYLKFLFNSFFVELKNVLTPLIGGSESAAAKSKITRIAQGDFSRNDIEFYDETGMIFSSRRSGETEKERTFHTTNALYDFTGSEKATIVMSVLLSQAVPTSFHRSLINSKNMGVNGFRMVTALNVMGAQKKLIKHDGSVDEIQNLRGLGGAKFRVSKIGNNFKISFDWTCYYEAQLDNEEILPLEKDEVIAIRTKAEFIVDGEKAAAGELAFEIPDGVERTYEGRLRVN